MKKDKKKRNRTRHDFLLTLFPDKKEEYSEIELNGYHLVRQWNGGSREWEVAIWTKESWINRQQFLEWSREAQSKGNPTARTSGGAETSGSPALTSMKNETGSV
jgi:hypothetical protein